MTLKLINSCTLKDQRNTCWH